MCKICILNRMIDTTATTLARELHEFLARVEHGETVRIRKHGRTVARLVPDCGFMSGKEFSRLFNGYKADALDKASANAIAANLAELDKDYDALAH